MIPVDSQRLIDLLTDCQQDINQEIIDQWPESIAQEIVDNLYQCAVTLRGSNLKCSVQLAKRIILIGSRLNNSEFIAIGKMTLGDTLHNMGQVVEAWKNLDAASKTFLDIENTVGWARTIIGKLFIAVDVNRVAEVLADSEAARKILKQTNNIERLVGLEINFAALHDRLGNYRKAIYTYDATEKLLAEVEQKSLGDLPVFRIDAALYRANILLNKGSCYLYLGDPTTALQAFETAKKIYAEFELDSYIDTVHYNISHVLLWQGKYRNALDLLYQTRQRLATDQDEEKELIAYIEQRIAECNLILNRYHKAKMAAEAALEGFQELNKNSELIETYCYLAQAERLLGDLKNAHKTLDKAHNIYLGMSEPKIPTWQGIIQLYRAQIYFDQNQARLSEKTVKKAVQIFQDSSQQLYFVQASVLLVKSLVAQNQYDEAYQIAHKTMDIADNQEILASLHTLLGKIAKQRDKPNLNAAMKHFQKSIESIETLQHELALTVRSRYLEDKQEPYRFLIDIYLRLAEGEKAFNILERSKYHLIDYVDNPEYLLWTEKDQLTLNNIKQVQIYRQEHNAKLHAISALQEKFILAKTHKKALNESQLQNPLEQDEASQRIDDLRTEIKAQNNEKLKLERQIQDLIEQLNVHNEQRTINRSFDIASVKGIQNNILSDDTVIIEYFNNGNNWWVFVITNECFEVIELAPSVEEITQYIKRFYGLIKGTIKIELNEHNHKFLGNSHHQWNQYLQYFYDNLLEPIFRHKLIAKYIAITRSVIVVPYGPLHNIPFSALFDGKHYLIERHEVSVLPLANWVTRKIVPQKKGALSLTTDNTGSFANLSTWIARLFGNVAMSHIGLDATSSYLDRPVCQILHIAAHGRYFDDNPNLSYIELADGRLFASDMWTRDMQYELVMLGACETGRVKVAPGDELIGLGSSFLYAGAQSLMMSLWPIKNQPTIEFMKHFYKSISKKASKSRALQHAQKVLMRQFPHPLFWAPFQLMGNIQPLSD